MKAYRLVSSLLTSVCGYGFLRVPNYARRSNRLSGLPRSGRSIAAYSAVEVATFAGSLLSHISRVASSRTREGWRLRIGRGDLYPAFFVPKLCEVPMFRYLLSSRFLRFRLRLSSQISNLAGHTAATVALGALLVLPVLYFGEVL